MASSLPTALVSVTTSGVIGDPIEDAWRAVKDWGDATAFGTRSCLLVREELDSTPLYCLMHFTPSRARAGVHVCPQCILCALKRLFCTGGREGAHNWRVAQVGVGAVRTRCGAAHRLRRWQLLAVRCCSLYSLWGAWLGHAACVHLDFLACANRFAYFLSAHERPAGQTTYST